MFVISCVKKKKRSKTMKEREQWGSRFGFIMAAVGSAIGLGNIWRFPYQAYDNGGGAFLIPYFFAMLTAGIPMLILEFGIGHKIKGAAPTVFARLSNTFGTKGKWEWLGWWQTLIAVVISIYYVAVVAWTISYIFFSAQGAWGTDTKAFFFGKYLNLSNSPLELGGIQWNIAIVLFITWFIVWIVLFSGVKKGIELANKIFMPTLIVLMLVLMFKNISLDGASEGLNWLFKPDFSKIYDYNVWAAAYGQIFYSMSIAFAIMITYSSYLPKKTDIVNNAFITGLLNCGFSMIAGITIFSILGHMATVEGKAVNEVVSSGVGLAFITIPKAISYMPSPEIFGVVFFLSLTIAGMSSQISITETVTSSFMDKFGYSRKRTATVYCIAGMAISMLFATGAGLLILDIVDHFINNFGILFAGLTEVILMSWIFKLDAIKEHVNSISDFKVYKWWDVCLKFITPLVLGYMAISNLIDEFTKAYGGYPIDALIMLGWTLVLGIIIVSFILQTTSGDEHHLEGKTN